MRHDTSTNFDNYKKDFDYLKIEKDIPEVTISLYGNMTSDQISTVTDYIANYFGKETEITFEFDFDVTAVVGTFNISWN